MNKNRGYYFRYFLRAGICLYLILISGQGLRAQTSLLNIPVSANYSEVQLQEVLSDITHQTGVDFSYSTSKIPIDARVTASFSLLPLSKVLEELFITLPVRYEVMDNYVILKRGEIRRESKEEISFYTLNGFIRDKRSGEYLIGATVYVKE